MRYGVEEIQTSLILREIRNSSVFTDEVYFSKGKGVKGTNSQKILIELLSFVDSHKVLVEGLKMVGD